MTCHAIYKHIPSFGLFFICEKGVVWVALGTLSKVVEMFSEIASSHVTLFVVDT